MRNRVELADFLRARREALQPEDVGLPRGPRRRTGGLRREEVAALSGISADYYSRIEQQRGPQPSEQVLAGIARGLHLSLDERDHLFRVGGHPAPQRHPRGDHISPGTMRILDRLADTPAQVINRVGETLAQTRPAIALMGDDTRWTGLARSAVYRWFTDPASRAVHPEEDHALHSRVYAAQFRQACGAGVPRALEIREALLARSPEFARVWAEHRVGEGYPGVKRFAHRELGLLELRCQTLVDPEQAQTLLVFTAEPGSESHEKLLLLAAVG
ncbi:helix-turn-helix domain-containing protein [Actinosynnema pretiosum subsp. pretiosum]|uniref:Transcriptional regulator, XRE family n=2 Tax=Actinosynnema TaxID=40566 RepID=C6WK91_ACTMD|nr:helix-turn-helix transcriptional regulator [Actinosynnema mirum]ACU38304.1 transcriptional regulator, XRE family [Actinosynnema mirum DSM 43827]AXX31826.1 putative DNA-binding protein [Actinosynnema pretiosum subsp. pretiosum]QUF04184.1 helix-turn-helix domain-containing protein [Actinosynnema pretiosum subsp. pretiosum]